MDIKKALLLIKKYAPEEHKKDYEMISDELFRHLNCLVEEFIDLEQKLSKAREALEFYASANTYLDKMEIGCDAGYKARQTLKDIGD